MRTVRLHVRGGWSSLVACLVTCLCAAVLVACAGGAEPASEAAPGPEPATSAAVGQTLQAEGWAVTLIEPPERRKEVGAADMGGIGQGVVMDHFVAYGYTTLVQTEGWWLILGVEVTNDTGEMALLSKNLLTVTDSQGQEYKIEGMMVHLPHVWADERWMKDENYLMADAIDTGVTLEGPLIYEVPEDATGLTLRMRGTDETIDLGI